MSPGKLAAQVAHCSEAYWLQKLRGECMYDIEVNSNDGYNIRVVVPQEIYDSYITADFVKTICEARNKNHLLKAVDIAKELRLRENDDYGFIYDKCLTELRSEEDDGTTLTGIWFRPLDDDIAHAISRNYHLYV